MNIGDKVKILSPFDIHYPEVYEIVDIKGDTYTVLINETRIDFNLMYLQLWQ